MVYKTKDTSWFGSEYNMNIYRGCCHGCIYCDSRSDCYRVEDFDRVRAKENALVLIRDDLRRKVKKGVIGTGAMSDPYNPFEKELQLTRHALELMHAYGFGVAIATKSPLVTRDIDILQDIKTHSPVIVKITVTSADDALCEKTEPYAPPPSQRFEAIHRLSESGVYCGILLMPVLPYINDTAENILQILSLAAKNGARFVYAGLGVTLRGNQREYFNKRLDENFPGLSSKYAAKYGNAYRCAVPNVKKLQSLFAKECERLGLLYEMRDIINSYKLGYEDTQLSLF